MIFISKILSAVFNKWNNAKDQYRLNSYMKVITGNNYRLGKETYISYPKNIVIGGDPTLMAED